MLWWTDRFRHELDEMVFVRDSHDLFKTFEVENIIQCATLSATASLERTESRWLPWHFRSDFPNKDDANWKKHIILKKGKEPGGIDIHYKEIIKMAGVGGASCA
jgi:succinate dehydrogenase/fumarate reductase flavoprotein subunit